MGSFTWKRWWRYLAAVAACALMGWFAFVAGSRVPLLAHFNLGMHELGHMLAMPLPTMVMFIMGSAVQVAVPLGLAAYFIVHGDRAAGAFTLGWAGSSAWEVSVYIADAPYERLQLIGGQHDWAYLLGGNGWDAMTAAGSIATWVKGIGMLLVVAGIAVAMSGALQQQRARSGPRSVRRSAWPTGPVRPARVPTSDPWTPRTVPQPDQHERR